MPDDGRLMTVVDDQRPTGRGTARRRLLDAAVDVIRGKGLSATSVDDLCAAAGVTKGAFFHHFESKQALAVAAAAHWSETTGALFAAADYHDLDDPIDRIFGYLELRGQLINGSPADYTCLVGTMTQEAFATHPEVRDACADSIFGHAATLEPDFAAALGQARQPLRGRRRRTRHLHPSRVAGQLRAEQGGRRPQARARRHHPSPSLLRIPVHRSTRRNEP